MRTNSSLHIVTVATDIKYYMPYLIQSIKRNNNELIILGLNMKWGGWVWRLNVINEYISKLPEDDIICFCDGYDVLCLRDLNEMIDEFNKIKNREHCKIICSHDLTFSNNKKKSALWFTCSITDDVINGGFYIGQIKDIKYMLHIISSYSSKDDQILINMFNIRNPGLIYIDKYCEIFYTIIRHNQDIQKFIKIKNNKVYSLLNTRPFFIHAASNGFLDSTIIKLKYNYDYNNQVDNMLKNEDFRKYLNKNIYIFINFLHTYKIKILFNLIILILVIKLVY